MGLRNRSRSFLAVAILLFAVVGCGGGPSRPPTYSVTGQITDNGKPVADVDVAFRPDNTAGGQKPANGKTDSEGRYTLTTFSFGDGAMAGSYRVTLSKFDIAAGGSADVDSDDYVPPDASGSIKPPKNQLPKKLSDPETSGLTATIDPAAKENVFDFSIGN
jgi:hypothetical protein